MGYYNVRPMLRSGQLEILPSIELLLTFGQAGFWAAIGAFDILIDLFITVLPTWLLYDVQLPWRKKIFVIIAFTGRIL